MSDVSTYEMRALEHRIEILERARKDDLERRQRHADLRATVWCGLVILFSVMVWTVIITVAIVDKKG